jgi:hypothetical protein
MRRRFQGASMRHVGQRPELLRILRGGIEAMGVLHRDQAIGFAVNQHDRARRKGADDT